MSRYIDADALMEKAEQEQRIYMDEYNAMESGYTDEERELARTAYSTMTDCVALIINAPTVDAAPVVRCRDCKHHEVCKNGVNGWCNWHGCPTDVTYFCADGERRSDEQQSKG